MFKIAVASILQSMEPLRVQYFVVNNNYLCIREHIATCRKFSSPNICEFAVYLYSIFDGERNGRMTRIGEEDTKRSLHNILFVLRFVI